MAVPSAKLVNSACFLSRSIHAHHGSPTGLSIGPHSADAVPRIRLIWWFAFAFIALEEAGNKRLPGQRRQSDPPCLPVIHNPVGIVDRDYLDHRARLRGVVADLVTVFARN